MHKLHKELRERRVHNCGSFFEVVGRFIMTFSILVCALLINRVWNDMANYILSAYKLGKVWGYMYNYTV